MGCGCGLKGFGALSTPTAAATTAARSLATAAWAPLPSVSSTAVYDNPVTGLTFGGGVSRVPTVGGVTLALPNATAAGTRVASMSVGPAVSLTSPERSGPLVIGATQSREGEVAVQVVPEKWCGDPPLPACPSEALPPVVDGRGRPDVILSPPQAPPSTSRVPYWIAGGIVALVAVWAFRPKKRAFKSNRRSPYPRARTGKWPGGVYGGYGGIADLLVMLDGGRMTSKRKRRPGESRHKGFGRLPRR